MNHAGALHAGVQAALLDTACGYVAGTAAGNVVALQLNLQFLSLSQGRPLRGAGAGDEGGQGATLRGRRADRLARRRGGAGGERECGAGEGGVKRDIGIVSPEFTDAD